MRRCLSVVGAVITLAAVIILVLWRLIVLPDYWTQLAVALTLLAVGILYWGFKPDINKVFKERARPKLAVSEAVLNPGEEVREIHVRFRGGKVRKSEARFFYVTVEHVGGQAAEDLTPFYGERYPMIIVPVTGKSAITIDYDYTAEEFDEELREIGQQAFIYAVLRDRKKVRETVDLRPGNLPVRFALFFTVQGFPQICIPGFTAIHRFMPCTVKIVLCLVASNLPFFQAATFEVSAQSWDSFQVKQIGQT